MTIKAALNSKRAGDVQVCIVLSQLKLNHFHALYNPPLTQEQLPRGVEASKNTYSKRKWMIHEMAPKKTVGNEILRKSKRDAEEEKGRD